MPSSRVLRWLPFAAIVGIYLLELRIDVIDVDSAEYAAIAREMFATKSFLIVKNRGGDYLDKPPLTFWLAALSYAAFGVSTVAYKLPSFLFALLGLFSTYRLGLLLMSERAAYTAALALGTSLATFLWTNDVRTDTILMGCVAFTLWQLTAFRLRGGWGHFVFGFIGMGFAMLAKGPIGAMVPVLALGTDAVLKRDWRWLFHPRWMLGALIVLVVLAPMSWGLYRQFGWNGIRFFYWTQSFGRITGESPWRDSTTPLFFTHTILWELLPWTAFFVVGFVLDTRELIRSRFRIAPPQEAITWAGFLLPFVAFSLSHYKLPHYIYVMAPLECLIIARQVERALESRRFKVFVGVQLGLCLVIWAILAWIVFVVFPVHNLVLWPVLAASLLVMRRLSRSSVEPWTQLIGPSTATILGFAAMLALHFFPTLLTYQAPTMAAHRALAKGIPPDRIFTLHGEAYSFDFELRRSVPRLPDAAALRPLIQTQDAWVLTNDEGMQQLEAAGLPVRDDLWLRNYPISRLSLPFLRPETRQSRIEPAHFVHVAHLGGTAGTPASSGTPPSGAAGGAGG